MYKDFINTLFKERELTDDISSGMSHVSIESITDGSVAFNNSPPYLVMSGIDPVLCSFLSQVSSYNPWVSGVWSVFFIVVLLLEVLMDVIILHWRDHVD